MNSLYDKLKAKLTGQKFHDFDLDNPEITNVKINDEKYYFTVFHCKNCDKTLGLDRWQMEQLPYQMRIGCKG